MKSGTVTTELYESLKLRSILKDASIYEGNKMDLAIAVMVFGTILVMFTRDVVDN